CFYDADLEDATRGAAREEESDLFRLTQKIEHEESVRAAPLIRPSGTFSPRAGRRDFRCQRGGAVSNGALVTLALGVASVSALNSATNDARSAHDNCGACLSNTSSSVFALPSRLYGAVSITLRSVGTPAPREKFGPEWHDTQPRADMSCSPRQASAGIAL